VLALLLFPTILMILVLVDRERMERVGARTIVERADFMIDREADITVMFA
jgi:hypothetical protein